MKTFLHLGAGLLRGLFAVTVGLFALLGAFFALAGRANRDDAEDEEEFNPPSRSYGHTRYGREPILGDGRGAISGEKVVYYD